MPCCVAAYQQHSFVTHTPGHVCVGPPQAIDAIVSAEGATAKDVADAAVSLAYLQVKGNRRYGPPSLQYVPTCGCLSACTLMVCLGASAAMLS